MKKEINIPAGYSLEQAVNILLDANKRKESVYCEFNGHILYSDDISMDKAYMEVLGKRKSNFEKEKNEWNEKYDREQKMLEERAIANIPNWIEEGNKLIFPERQAKWVDCVNARVKDIYHGVELYNVLEIMNALENGSSMDEVKQIFEEQGHSYMSASLVRYLVFEFSSKGPEFWEATATDFISYEGEKMLEEKKLENIQLSEKNKSKSKRLK